VKDILSHLLPRLPGAEAFINRMVRDFVQGKSAVVLIPRSIDDDVLVSATIAALRMKDLLVDEVDVSQAGEGDSPFLLLRRVYMWDELAQNRCVSVSHLLRSDGLPQVTFLRGFDRIRADQRTSWIEFLKQWSDIAHSVAIDLEQPPCALAICMTPYSDEMLPDDNPRLAIHWWWSVLSLLDIRLACRLAKEPLNDLLNAETAWREALLPALAGSDLRLLEWLWDAILEDHQTVFARLRAFSGVYGRLVASRMPRQERSLTNHSFLPRQGSVKPQGADQRELWMDGLLDQIVEIGPVLSSAWLAAVGDDETLRHRLWRGQAALILPLINELRLTICQAITRRHRDTWLYDWNPPATVEEERRLPADPLAADWGQLEWALLAAPHGEQHRLPAVRHARQMRNELAHYRLVSFKDYVRLLRLID